jgi:hypothetical protein
VSSLDAAAAVDHLFRDAVLHPGDIDEHRLVDFMSETAALVGHDRDQLKPLRRAVRLARKLAKYWDDRDPTVLPDWRNGVDETLGAIGWRPQLDLVKTGLETAPDPVLYDAVKERHRAVHFTPWLEGVGFEEWLAER